MGNKTRIEKRHDGLYLTDDTGFCICLWFFPTTSFLIDGKNISPAEIKALFTDYLKNHSSFADSNQTVGFIEKAIADVIREKGLKIG